MDPSSKQDLSFGAPFSTTNAIQTFLSTRGQDAKRLRVTASPYFASKRSEPVSNPHQTSIPASQTPARPSEPLPTPDLHPLSSPRSFFVSLHLLQQRDVARRIEHLYSTAELIERGPLPQIPNSHPVTPSPSQQEEEADLILSPGTGLLCTNLQMIKQRSLPGQPSISPIQARIRSVYERYERLIIFVSEGRASGGGGGNVSNNETMNDTSLDERDCVALASLQGFVASLVDGDVQAIYVPGGEGELARWVVDLMIRAPDSAIKLSHEESQVCLSILLLHQFQVIPILRGIYKLLTEETDAVGDISPSSRSKSLCSARHLTRPLTLIFYCYFLTFVFGKHTSRKLLQGKGSQGDDISASCVPEDVPCSAYLTVRVAARWNETAYALRKGGGPERLTCQMIEYLFLSGLELEEGDAIAR